jgi:hypothetical protein
MSGYIVAFALVAGVVLSAQQPTPRLPIEPFRQFGSSVTPAFEGWYDNPDGSHTFLIGYLNRNSEQSLDVPIGPNNRIEPGGPDLGQPAHFLPGRQWGMFTITVPKEFTKEQRLTWTIVANGQAMSVPFKLNPDYLVSPFHDVAVNNTPPILRLLEDGPTTQGPRAAVTQASALSTNVATPLALNVWASRLERAVAEATSVRDADVVEVSRAGRGDVRQSQPRLRQAAWRHATVQRQGNDDRIVQRARRLPASPHRQRSVWAGRGR